MSDLVALDIETGVDLEKLVDAGLYISNFLQRPSSSRAGTAIAKKRPEAVACG